MIDRLFSWPVQSRHTDERYTPRSVFDALAVMFDLDPAAPPGGAPHVPCRAYYTADADGLAQPWHGLVWLNPPFSDPAPWIDRFLEHGRGVVLFPLSVNASWMLNLIRAVDAVHLLEHLRFDHPTHTGRHVPVLVALAGIGDGAPIVAAAAPRLRGVRLLVEKGSHRREQLFVESVEQAHDVEDAG